MIFGVSVVALPFALGAFPQRQRVPVKSLEQSFHNLKDANGNIIQMVEFNRGI